ncbi:MAG TPA: hypothetical protein VJ397_06305 [Thermoplasmata archaeon]|nr:hypothetical protein [Thermoplasmata archaeon]
MRRAGVLLAVGILLIAAAVFALFTAEGAIEEIAEAIAIVLGPLGAFLAFEGFLLLRREGLQT